MDSGTLLAIGLAMGVGLVGVLVPVVPGLLLIAGAGAVWAWLAGGIAPWLLFAVMLVVLAAGTVAKYVLPGRSLKEAGAPRSTLVLGAAGAIIGFFLIPVAGLPIGALAGIWLGERGRLGDNAAAARSTVATAKAIGLGMAVELAAGLVAVAIWVAGALALRP